MTETIERSYTTVDKAEWGNGPWQHEPDKVQWLDDATGYDCLIVRGPAGALCGYVGLPPEHPLHGADYNRVEVRGNDWDSPDVHGGLTFADSCQEGDDESVGICHVPLPGRPDGVWWFGFDCAHSGDACPKYASEGHWPSVPRDRYRDLGYVRREVASLAAQLVAATLASEEDAW